LVLISVFLPLAPCLLIAGFARWSNVDTLVTRSYASDPIRFSSSLLSLFPCLLLTSTLSRPQHPNYARMYVPPPFTIPNTTHSHPPRQYPPPNPPSPKIPQRLIRYHRFSLPQLALCILQEVSVKEVVRAVLVSFFFSQHRPFSPSLSPGEEWSRVGLPLIIILTTTQQVSTK
jgi:hypothetical protein